MKQHSFWHIKVLNKQLKLALQVASATAEDPNTPEKGSNPKHREPPCFERAAGPAEQYVRTHCHY